MSLIVTAFGLRSSTADPITVGLWPAEGVEKMLSTNIVLGLQFIVTAFPALPIVTVPMRAPSTVAGVCQAAYRRAVAGCVAPVPGMFCGPGGPGGRGGTR